MIDALNPLVQEFNNLILSSLAMLYAFVLFRSMLIDFHKYHVQAFPLVRFRVAFKTFLIIFGEAGLHSWVWLGRYCENTGSNCSIMSEFPFAFIPTIFVLVESVGFILIIELLAPGSWRNYRWVLAIVAVLSWAVAWFSPFRPYWGSLYRFIVDLI